MQLLSLLTSWKNIALYTIAVAVITAGVTMHVYGKFIDADILKIRDKQLELALKAPAAIITKQQALRKTNVQAQPCYSTKLPDDVIKLLK